MEYKKEDYFETNKNEHGNLKINIFKFPKTVYKYRGCTKLTIKAFEDNLLFMSKPIISENPFKFTFKVSKNKLIKKYEEYALKKLEKYSKSSTWIRVAFEEYAYFIKRGFELFVKSYLEQQKDNHFIVGFSTIINEEILWSQYADNARGFAIEYTFDSLINHKIEYNENINELEDFFKSLNIEIKKDIEASFNITPVVYAKGKHDATDDLIKILDILIKQFDDENANISKIENDLKYYFNQDRTINSVDSFNRRDKLWEYTNEWRYLIPASKVSNKLNKKKHIRVNNLIPKAIYLGHNINAKNKQKLIKIAKKKNIEIYRMKPNYYLSKIENLTCKKI